LKILTGKYKGRTLRTVNDLSVRPATGRVRQTVFDVLTLRGFPDGARVLDLFAGSGSLGIEALSRGAAHATFVESDPRAVECLERNIRMLGCDGIATILHMDAMTYVENGRGEFDLVFADPPYRFGGTRQIPENLMHRDMVFTGGYVLIEHSKEISFADSPLYTVELEKRFGRTVVSFLKHRGEQQGG